MPRKFVAKVPPIARICDCLLLVQPAARCPTGRCSQRGRRAPTKHAKTEDKPRSEMLPAIPTGAGGRWIDHDPADPEDDRDLLEDSDLVDDDFDLDD